MISRTSDTAGCRAADAGGRPSAWLRLLPAQRRRRCRPARTRCRNLPRRRCAGADAEAMPTQMSTSGSGAGLEPAQCRCLDADQPVRPSKARADAASRRRRRHVVVVQGQANGAAAVSVKQPLSPFLDARVGADMTVARQPQTLTQLGAAAAETRQWRQPPQSSGTAWAAITAPGVGSIWDKTAVEARVDPSQEQSKLGTSLSKSLPLSEQYSLTLQNGYNVIQQGIVPVPGIAGAPGAQLRNRAIGQAEHRRHRHQLHRRPDAVVDRRQMAAQDRRRAETVRRRQHFRLDRRNRAGHHEQEPQRGLQAQLVALAQPRVPQIPAKDRALPHIGRDAVKIGSPDGARLISSCGGHPRSRQRETGEQPMNATFVLKKLNQLKRTAILPRSRKSRPASATSSATTSPICAARRRAC